VNRQSAVAAPDKLGQDALGDFRILAHEPETGAGAELIGDRRVLALKVGN
jgi:hypothetical protein